MAIVSIGRSRLPPELIRWLATSGIIVTSEPVRDRIAAVDPRHVGGNERDEVIDACRPALKGNDDSQGTLQ